MTARVGQEFSGTAIAPRYAQSEALDALLSSLFARRSNPIAMGLDRVNRVGEALGFQPSEDQAGFQLRGVGVTVVVGGTNGKGSTVAFLESILQSAGYRTAAYTSPHLLHFEERLRVHGEVVGSDAWCRALEQVLTAEAAVLPEGDGLSPFEATTLAAAVLIEQAGVDVAILEVGLGGRLDAVNALASDCAVLTSIDLDHQRYLGETRSLIGLEKIEIARRGRPVVIGDPAPPEGLLERAEAIGAEIWLAGRDFNYQGDRQQWSWAGRGQRRNAMAYPGLRGVNQLLNASCALATLAALADRCPVSMGAIRQGLLSVELPGRFQVMAGQPAVVLDVAHNPHAAAVLAANLDQMGFYPDTIAVVGLLEDKDAESMFRHLMSRVDHWVLVDLTGPEVGGRARTAQALSDILVRLQGTLPDGGRPGQGAASFECASTPEEGLAAAARRAAREDRILIFGSFVLAGALYQTARRLGEAPHAG